MTAYQRPSKKAFEKEDARAQLKSAAGRKPGYKAAPLIDEEDMIDEREMRRAQNRLKRRDYEELAEDDQADDLFEDPLENYENVIKEAPSILEQDHPR